MTSMEPRVVKKSVFPIAQSTPRTEFPFVIEKSFNWFNFWCKLVKFRRI